MIAFSPRRFAAELSRPARISADDARRFRRATIRVGTASAAIVSGALVWAEAAFGPPWTSSIQFALSAATWALWLLALYFLLRLATDMPLFIWKGLPSLPPSELAPVHHYASAPLAAAVVLAPIVGSMVYIQLAVAHRMMADLAIELLLLGEALLVLLWGAWIWVVALVLMRTASRAPRARVLVLAFYLPLHWFMMASMMSMSGAVAMMIGAWVLSLIWPELRF